MIHDLLKDEPNIIKIIGVGGAGSNAVTYMYQQGIVGVDYAICNTDSQAMSLSPVPVKISLGQALTEGMGAGNKPSRGKQACLESIEDIRRFLDDGTKMVFITAGMGGGTGTGAAPIIAKAAQELGILTVGIVTLPFSFEGKTRVENGSEGLEELRKSVDCLVVISNDKLRDIFGNLTFKQAFGQADNILCTAAKGIAEIITVPGYVNVDFEDVNTTMRGSGVAMMGTSAVEGENRAFRAADEALRSPLLMDNDIYGAKNLLVNITSGVKEVTMDEIFEITRFVQEKAGENANLIWGNCYDERLGEKLSVTVIATGFESSERFGSHRQAGDRQTKTESVTRVSLDDETDRVKPTQPSPTIESITYGSLFDNIDEKPASKMEIVFDDILDTVGKIRNGNSANSDPFIRTENPDDITPEERRRRIEEAQRRKQEAQSRQLSVVKLNSPQAIVELESQPAYVRRNIQLDDVQGSGQNHLSDWLVKVGETGEPKLSENPSLHADVD